MLWCEFLTSFNHENLLSRLSKTTHPPFFRQLLSLHLLAVSFLVFLLICRYQLLSTLIFQWDNFPVVMITWIILSTLAEKTTQKSYLAYFCEVLMLIFRNTPLNKQVKMKDNSTHDKWCRFSYCNMILTAGITYDDFDLVCFISFNYHSNKTPQNETIHLLLPSNKTVHWIISTIRFSLRSIFRKKSYPLLATKRRTSHRVNMRK